MNNDEIVKVEDSVTNGSKLFAGVVVEIMLLVALFRYGLGIALEHYGPFGSMLLLAVGAVALAYLSIWNFRLVRKITTRRKTQTQGNINNDSNQV